MWTFTKDLLSSAGFMPHGQCYLWKPDILWLHVGSDLLIALAYYSIPVALGYFVLKRRDIAYPSIFLLFGAFILLCGTTHIMGIWTTWNGTYRLEGVIKFLTAGVSVATAAVLWPIIPQALMLPSPTELQQANQDLQEEIAERRRIEAELIEARNLLEQRVEERTASLLQANQELEREIAERQQAEAGLHASTERTRAILETTVDAVITIDEHGLIESFNPAAEQMFGYASVDVIGQNVRMLMPSPYRDEHDGYLDHYRHTGERRIIGIGREVVGRRQDGSTFPMELAVSEVRVADQRLFTGIVRDITERQAARRALQEAHATLERRVEERTAELQQLNIKLRKEAREREQAQARLSESEYRFRSIVQGSIQGIGIHQEDGVIQFANPALATMLGYDYPDDLIGRSYKVIAAPHEHARLESYFQARSRSEPAPSRYEYQAVRTDGELIWLECLVTRLTWGDKPSNLVTFVDITERKQAEDALRQAERLASLGTFAAGIAHELNNPLYAISSTAEYARDRLMSPDKIDEMGDCFGDILEDAGRCSEIVKRVLNFAREGRGTKLPTDLHPIIQNAWNLTQRYAEQHDVQISLELASAQPRIIGNREDLELALVNLIRNAVEATPEKGHVSLQTVVATERVEIRIQDTGTGLSPEEIRHVFEPFYTTRQGSGGTGLGMSIAHRIITDHDGAIDLQSTPGQGTAVQVVLPLSTSEEIPSV